MNQNDCGQKNSYTLLDCLSPKDGAILAAAIADILADGLNSNQIAALGGFITIIGDSMQYISAQMELCESRNTNQER